MMPEEKINAEKAAELLGISQVSIRNWIKHNYLNPVGPTGKQYLLREVLQLKQDIETGKINRLKQRANKIKANKTFAPVEYMIDENSYSKVNYLAAYIISHEFQTEMAVFLLALNLFKGKGDILSSDFKEIVSFPPEIFLRKTVLREFQAFYREVNDLRQSKTDEEPPGAEFLLNFDLPKESDILGLIYQSLLYEGKKSSLGSYFTPKKMVYDIVKDNLQPDWKALDPCCGTGQFLLAFADDLDNPEGIFGYDIDPMAVRIARLNLLHRFPQEFDPQVFHMDTLKETGTVLFPENRFDFIATNPPWGSMLKKNVLKKLFKDFPEIISGESFSYFLLISIGLLKEGGTLSFVLPQAMLYVKTHADIRKYILDHCVIQKILSLGQAFKNVMSPVIRIDLVKEKPADHSQIFVISKEERYTIPQKRFLDNRGFVFDINLKEKDREIISRVFLPQHTTLQNNADWALGIVTGDNQRYLRKHPAAGYEPIYKGSDVGLYRLKKTDTYIRFLPEKFQQTASEEKYRAKEKLVYKFISDSLAFAYDNTGSLTLNSANILIPKPEYPLKVIMALFNSTLYNFLFKKKYTSVKVLRGDLEQLPLPLWPKDVFDRIEMMVEQIMQNKSDYFSLDEYLMDQFEIPREDRAYIRSCFPPKKRY
ncbi:MAG: Modification methylase VspI [Candidatus Dichloromethanomonas elyunquensis]|nr:MAG: Modification methylase VspI [Candidatus Dichloromethanomonas elyunquensis]